MFALYLLSVMDRPLSLIFSNKKSDCQPDRHMNRRVDTDILVDTGISVDRQVGLNTNRNIQE